MLIDPSMYRDYIQYDKKGEPVLYVRMSKALYGFLKSTLDFYLKLRGNFESIGFEFNPYDPCVANKVIQGSQMTVIWHVDDLKVSHVKPEVNMQFAEWMKGIYGEKLTGHRGKIHNYLGMDMDWSKKGKISFSMIKYLYKVLEDFIEDIRNLSVTPAVDYLFKIREDTEQMKIPEELAIIFYTTVAQLLFVSQRARRDIQTPVSFLIKRVKTPDKDDWNKLVRTLQYLKATIHMKLTLKIDAMNIFCWSIDASHQVRDNCKGHTWGGSYNGGGSHTELLFWEKYNYQEFLRD